MLIIVVALLNLSWGAVTDGEEIKTNAQKAQLGAYERPQACVLPETTFALNRPFSSNNKTYEAGTEVYVDAEGNAFTFTGDADDAAIDMGTNSSQFNCNDITVIQVDEKTGELDEYNIPVDFELAGTGNKPKKRGGVTHCYRAVKAKVKHKVTLTGVSAFMAAPQLREAKFTEYKNYKSAPQGSICVFGAGGRQTPSGGHRHGHIGIKGTAGITNPQAGFDLKRPFIACFHKK